VHVIGVLDLRHGKAVHAVGGTRDRYQPVAPIPGAFSTAGDGDGLARHYVEQLGVDALYIADLNAIQSGPPQTALVTNLCRRGVPVYVDAGVTTVAAAQALLGAGAARVVVGLETLLSFDALDAICADIGGARVIFSLDLRNGKPITTGELRDKTPETMIKRAIGGGAESVLVLDLARVGTRTGLDLALLARARRATPAHVTLLTGGGVGAWSDLERIAALGCRGVLIASALQDGRLGAKEVAAARRL